MDIKRLLETGSPAPLLQDDSLERMISSALANPQLQKPANQNNPWLRQALATAAAVLVLIGAGIHFYPAPTVATVNQMSEDAYDDITDLMIYETMSDLS